MKSYIRLALFFYYKKIEFNFEEQLLPNRPTLFLGNHQNGLMDPILIATRKGQFSYFLTRASVFQKPWISKFLRSLLMLPVYRVRDGWDSLSKNKAIFKTCSQLLYENNAIVLFPEGNHNIKRQVRTLSKGFTRIIAETLNDHPDIEINLVPVGFNYRRAEEFADHVILNFGTPISSKNYKTPDTNATVLRMKVDVFNALTTLTTHLDGDDYDAKLQRLEGLNANFLDPTIVNQIVATQLKNCEAQPKQKQNPIKAIAKMGLCLSLFLPYAIWKLILEPKIKEPEFISTFRFAVAISLVPVFMLVIAVVLWLSFGAFYALLYLASVFVLDVMAVKL
ncbi:1-acyl-sn-glycerol-3-phosphate acyltransferase [Gelidibacter sp. DF109]|uniref:1-acyl-sn-glycerol-3-phosphate acyltransferase n=2 Tax=Gelidibacter pelagius TaxID=2819985 RepID=A0ABS3SWU6_9FLAO|nr:1-acyl-sn-glycerol-3-phosphate acyltransferase [Gelidibacter pelagius]